MILVPDSHRDKTLEDFDWQQLKPLKLRILSYLDESSPKGMIFIGDPGVGKTHLMIGIFKKLLDEGRLLGSEVLYIEWFELIRQQRLLINQKADADIMVRDLPHLFLIDDIKPDDTKLWHNTLQRVIEETYSEQKSGILSTNADNLEQLIERWELQDYYVSRLLSCFDIIKIKGKDWRIDGK